ncbi:hypothetical protein BJX63DRAFT_426698 [Aspergillus granulosus]|uniref:DUF7580 domain-containing protein n=1 Tax=Aspergillus granulosus TaxID=176169 RepID=A0ABR4I527_9EURO
METAGLILTTIPLILTALDKYIEACDTIRLFRTNKYRRYLERYSSTLAAQQAALLNTIEIVLGIKVSKESVDDLADPKGSKWKDPSLQAELQSKLGRDYDAFVNVLSDANHTLQELKHRLEQGANTSPDQSRSLIVGEFRKAKNILSKNKYDHLFVNLEASIGLLIRLVDQSIQNQERRQFEQGSQYGIVRTPAASIHRAILRDEPWRCPCRDKHSVRFVLDSNFQEKTPKIVFRMGIVTLNDSAKSIYCCQEIEVEPSQANAGAAQIMHMCTTIAAIGVLNEKRKLVGSLLEGEYRHSVFVGESSVGGLESQSLDDMLMSSSLAPWIPGFYFRKRDRLKLAIRLVWSVLHFHGNWLPEHWRSRDILFPMGPGGGTSQRTFEHPYLAWNVSQQGVTSPEISPVVTSRVLFPLGLALVELSLCRSISALQRPEDDNPEESVSLLKTANRCLDAVCSESGAAYGTVVQRCLYWSETRETNPDDETFRAAFYRLVLTPLLNTMQAFDGTRPC